MNTYAKRTQVLFGTIALLGVLWPAGRRIEATVPQGVTFTVLNRATVPEFDASRKFRQRTQEPDRPSSKSWKINLRATRMIDVVTVFFTVQPGGHSGWHTHPGPAIFTVSAGTLTMYEGDDPSCRPHVFPAGTGSIEAEDSGHIHMLRNETGSVAETIVTFLVPVGAPIRTDLADPGNCPF